MVKFSILVPTRERMKHVERLLCSMRDTANNINSFEVLFMYDKDDVVTGAYLDNCRFRFKFRIRAFSRHRSEWLNRDYYNQLTKFTEGEFLWLIGDDVMFVQKDWDKIILEEIEKYLMKRKTRIVYVNIKDDTPPPPGMPIKYANFPMISKEAVRVVGYFMPPKIPSWSSDYYIYTIYSHPKVDRVLNINKLFLKHIRSDVEDIVTSRQRGIFSKYNVEEILAKCFEEEAPLKRGAIMNYIITTVRRP